MDFILQYRHFDVHIELVVSERDTIEGIFDLKGHEFEILMSRIFEYDRSPEMRLSEL
jgi:hypothetical protein